VCCVLCVVVCCALLCVCVLSLYCHVVDMSTFVRILFKQFTYIPTKTISICKQGKASKHQISNPQRLLTILFYVHGISKEKVLLLAKNIPSPQLAIPPPPAL